MNIAYICYNSAKCSLRTVRHTHCHISFLWRTMCSNPFEDPSWFRMNIRWGITEEAYLTSSPTSVRMLVLYNLRKSSLTTYCMTPIRGVFRMLWSVCNHKNKGLNLLTCSASEPKNSMRGGVLDCTLTPVAAAMILRSTATIQLKPRREPLSYSSQLSFLVFARTSSQKTSLKCK